MPHRVKNKHRARHRSQTVKAANLSRPALPLPAEQTDAIAVTDSTASSTLPVAASAEQAASE